MGERLSDEDLLRWFVERIVIREVKWGLNPIGRVGCVCVLEHSVDNPFVPIFRFACVRLGKDPRKDA